MALTSGSRLGIYVIESELGSGGMGEVYRARDELLNRTVAIKLLLPAQAGDGERRARFLQEARAASALNHPNIITIYGIGTEDGRDYLAMEYLSGKALDASIPKDGLRLNLAVNYGLQITEAMCAAERAGIVHRDLKPANVMISESGLLKVLDFGLAKAILPANAVASDGTAMLDQTLDNPNPGCTQQGSILGTAAYMSPEQAEGASVDARSDIFAFGCVFYEMLTGISPFKRDSVILSLSAVLRDQPKALSEIAKSLPSGADRIVQRCLQKKRERRVQSWADLRALLEELKEDSEPGSPEAIAKKKAHLKPSIKRAMWASVLGIFLITGATVFYKHGRSAAPAPLLTDSILASLPGIVTHPNLSPDGNQVAFAWDGGTDIATQIYLKVVGIGEPPLRLTNGTESASVPVWSPNGTSIAFLSSSGSNAGIKLSATSEAPPLTRLLVMSALGGTPREIASFEAYPRDMSWSLDGSSIFVSADNAIYAFSVAGKERRKILDAPPNHVYRSATLSPDGHTLALIDSVGHHESRNESQIYLMNIGEDSTVQGAPRLLRIDQDAVNSLAWTRDSKALVIGGGLSMDRSSLWRVPINGDPETGFGDIGDGKLAPTIVGASGRHGGRLVYLHIISDTDIWRIPQDNGKPGVPVPLIASTKHEWDPRFSPDGKKIAYSSDQGGLTDIWVADANAYGTTQLTTFKGHGTGGARWSPDGKQIAFLSKIEDQWEIFVIDAQGGKPTRIMNHPAHDTAPMWSPDGKWIYFASDRAERFEIWKVAPMENAVPVQVTHHGGYAAIFSPDGKAMFYSKKNPAEGIWEQTLVNGEPSGEEIQILPVHLSNWGNFDVSRDGIAYVPVELGTAHIYFYRFSNRSTTQVAQFNGTPDFGISISAVDNSILFTQVTKPRRELVLVENFK